MTPEEAIKYGKKWLKVNCLLTEKDRIFIQEALKALKQVSKIKKIVNKDQTL